MVDEHSNNPNTDDELDTTTSQSDEDIFNDSLEITKSEYAFINKSKIITDNIIPNFKDKSYLKESELIKFEDEDIYHCTEGIELLNANDNPQIYCHIRHVKKYNRFALGLMKAGGRNKTSGHARYAENVRNVKILFQQNEDKAAEIPTRGGARRGANYIPKGSEKVMLALMDEYKVEREQIKKYINDGENLSLEILDYLVEVDASQDFFRKIRNQIYNINKKNKAFFDWPEEKTSITKEDHDEADDHIDDVLYENIVKAFKEYKIDKDKKIVEFSETTEADQEDKILIVHDIIKSFNLPEEEKTSTTPEMKLPTPQKDETQHFNKEQIIQDLLDLSEKIKKVVDVVDQQDLFKKSLDEACNNLMDIMKIAESYDTITIKFDITTDEPEIETANTIEQEEASAESSSDDEDNTEKLRNIEIENTMGTQHEVSKILSPEGINKFEKPLPSCNDKPASSLFQKLMADIERKAKNNNQ